MAAVAKKDIFSTLKPPFFQFLQQLEQVVKTITKLLVATPWAGE
jgi:hypothetical protein